MNFGLQSRRILLPHAEPTIQKPSEKKSGVCPVFDQQSITTKRNRLSLDTETERLHFDEISSSQHKIQRLSMPMKLDAVAPSSLTHRKKRRLQFADDVTEMTKRQLKNNIVRGKDTCLPFILPAAKPSTAEELLTRPGQKRLSHPVLLQLWKRNAVMTKTSGMTEEEKNDPSWTTSELLRVERELAEKHNDDMKGRPKHSTRIHRSSVAMTVVTTATVARDISENTLNTIVERSVTVPLMQSKAIALETNENDSASAEYLGYRSDIKLEREVSIDETGTGHKVSLENQTIPKLESNGSSIVIVKTESEVSLNETGTKHRDILEDQTIPKLELIDPSIDIALEPEVYIDRDIDADGKTVDERESTNRINLKRRKVKRRFSTRSRRKNPKTNKL